MSAKKKTDTRLTDARLAELTQTVISEIGGRIGGQGFVLLLRLFCKRQARGFSSLLLRLEDGLSSPTSWLAASEAASALSGSLEARGLQRVPTEGPLLVVANHPGMADAIAAFSCLPRADVRVVAGKSPILTNLPNISQRLLTLPENNAGGFVVLREMIDWLRQGGAVFYFPYGLLEPDPALIPGAANTIAKWSDSIGVILSKAPQTQLLPMLISSVLNPRAWQACLPRLSKSAKRRQQLAMVWQFIRYASQRENGWKTTMRVDIGEPLPTRALSASLNPTEITNVARAAFAGLLAEVYPDDPGLIPMCDYLT